MSNHDPVFRLRLRAMALAQELGSVQTAYRMLGINPSTSLTTAGEPTGWCLGDDITFCSRGSGARPGCPTRPR
jgi:hypothetical protein